jgi:chromosome segregation ATPase
MGELQDLVFEVMSRHCHGIERGNRKYDRLAVGANYAETVNKSVRKLHHDLPLEIEALEQKRDALQADLPELAARVAEMQGRVAKLEAEAAERELTAAKVKRLRVYRDRLSDRVRDLEAREAELEALQAKYNRLTVEVENLEDRAEIAKRARIHAEKGRRSAVEGSQKAEPVFPQWGVREAQLEASEAALRASEVALDSREKRLKHREGLVIGLAQAIRGVLEEASEWLGEAIPITFQGALPALRMALDKFKIRQEQNATSPEEEPGGPEMEM